jgi:hypothetical protein
VRLDNLNLNYQAVRECNVLSVNSFPRVFLRELSGC